MTESKTIGIVYSTVDGHTLKICKFISEILTKLGWNVELHDISSFDKDITSYSKFIIGASVRYGKHNKYVEQFILNHNKELEHVDAAFFSVNLVARKTEKNSAETNPYVIKFLNQITWKPRTVGVFAGRLDYASYSFFDSLMIKLIMKITKGPTKSEKPIEFTNWSRVEAFAKLVVEG